MKKTLYIAVIALLLAACGSNETSTNEQPLPKDNAVEPYEPESYQTNTEGGVVGDNEESASNEDPFKAN